MNQAAPAGQVQVDEKLRWSFRDFLWGDVPWLFGLLRVPVKLIVALFVALLLHESFAAWRLSVTQDDATALAELFTGISAESGELGRTVPPKGAGYKRVAFCLEAKPQVEGGCPEARADTRLNEADVASGLGYRVLGVTDEGEKLLTSGAFFRVKKHFGLISEGHIEESTDTLLRRLELALFNGPAVHASEIKLCAGTRTLLSGPQCGVTGWVGYLLGAETAELVVPPAASTAAATPAAEAPAAPAAEAPVAAAAATQATEELKRNTILTRLIGDLRIASMFVGPVQFGTLAIFCYALLETLGLWLRWVAPGDRLRFALGPTQMADTVKVLGKSRVLSISDRMMIAAMRVVKRTTDEPKQPRQRAAGGVPPEGSTDELTPDTEFVEVLSSYRDYLHEEAVGRQDALEMLGDTMLKLAFLGTVYGISAALFSARGLDTADPILRLSTKAAMYAGIGLGFGTTILGIACSIVAAIFRTNLAASWSNEIGAAYQRILKAGRGGVENIAKDAAKKSLEVIDPPIPRENRFKTVELLGVIVIVALLAAVSFVLREEIGQVISVIQTFVGGLNGG